MPESSSIAIYQLRVVLCGVSPLVWRRLLVVSTTSIESVNFRGQASHAARRPAATDIFFLRIGHSDLVLGVQLLAHSLGSAHETEI
jgi:hypothetical protein